MEDQHDDRGNTSSTDSSVDAQLQPEIKLHKMAKSVYQRTMKQLFYCAIYACGMRNEVGCFNLPFNDLSVFRQDRRPTLINKSLTAGRVNDDSFSEHEMDIEKIILSLSNVADDQSRREQLSKLFDIKLQNQDGGESFMKLFDSAMIVVGDRIRLDVANLAATATVSQSLNYTSAVEGAEFPSFPLRSQHKSQLEGQLWACVDMMVQSKTLMKQARLE